MTQKMATTESTSTKLCRIVHVEDSETDADLLSVLLKRAKLPIDLLRLKDGEEAVKYLIGTKAEDGTPPFDLVVLDLGIPKVSGHEVLKRLSREGPRQPKRVIIFSGSENPEDQRQCRTLGADSYFIKPFSLNEYKAFVTGPLIQELKQACPCLADRLPN